MGEKKENAEKADYDRDNMKCALALWGRAECGTSMEMAAAFAVCHAVATYLGVEPK